jgi:transcription elongation GreA/GreB family factor
LGSLVAVLCEENNTSTTDFLFIAPVGGTRVAVNGHRIRVISPDSPLGSVLMGLSQGEDFEFTRPAGKAEFTLVEVA